MTKTKKFMLQHKQMNYIEKIENRESRYGPGTVSTISCTCNDCGESKMMNSALGARSFILNHRGHYTWIENVGSRKAS